MTELADFSFQGMNDCIRKQTPYLCYTLRTVSEMLTLATIR